MAIRMEFNWDRINAILTAPRTASLIQHKTARIADAATAQGSEVRTDMTFEGERVRGAVIAGYEHGATAENTRDLLLRALDGGSDE